MKIDINILPLAHQHQDHIFSKNANEGLYGIAIISNPQVSLIAVHVLKRHAALIILLITLVTFAILNQSLVSPQGIFGMDIVINEFDSNPPTGPQWIELYNPTDFAYSITLWKIVTRSTGITLTIPVGTSIAAKGYYVMDLPFPIMDPIGESIFLLDNNGLQIDKTPSLSKPVADNTAWARVPDGTDTDSMDDWKLQLATKGTSNGAPPPPPVTPTILCTLSSFSVEIGSSAIVSVFVSPPRSAPVTIQVRTAGTLDWSNLTTAPTGASGIYQYAWTPGTIGQYNIRAYVYPSDSFPGMYSLIVNLLVTKIRTQISCLVTKSRITLGQSLATYGYIIPALEGVNVMLTYRKPTGAPIVRYVLTGSGGLYNDTSFTPQEAGSWNVTASWEGDETHTSALSPLTRFNVESPPSLPFGMWLIICVVASVATAAVLLAAGLSSKVIQRPPRRVALCPLCRSTLLYVPSIQGWYCPQCRRRL